VHNATSAGLGPAPQTDAGPESLQPQAAPAAGSPEPAVPDPAEPAQQQPGSAIGNAAQKTWDCMSSFFKKC
jgi:hypothetical protein